MADDDIGLPKSTMLRAIKERLPADMRIAGDVNDMIVRCCEEFIHLVSTAANELCEKEKKSTILPEHILGALENLGFEPYLENLKKGKGILGIYAADAISFPPLGRFLLGSLLLSLLSYRASCLWYFWYSIRRLERGEKGGAKGREREEESKGRRRFISRRVACPSAAVVPAGAGADFRYYLRTGNCSARRDHYSGPFRGCAMKLCSGR